MFFLAVYIHIFRSLFYGSYKSPREVIWIIDFNLSFDDGRSVYGIRFTWGQMSFWGATA